MEKEWWERRYAEGRTSGKGSIGRGRAWKWSIIDEFTPEIPSLVDVGCGDLSFWEARFSKSYIGIDIAENIIEENRGKRLRQCGKSKAVFMNALLELREKFPEMSDLFDSMEEIYEVFEGTRDDLRTDT